MVQMESDARMMLTDSGGVQQEAYWLGVRTLCDDTEWVETVQSGWNILARTETAGIRQCVMSFAIPSKHAPFYGDSGTVGRLIAALEASRNVGQYSRAPARSRSPKPTASMRRRREMKTLIKYLYYGDSVNMVAASVCQLKCPVCTLKWRIREELGDGYLKFKDFKGFVDRYPNFKKIEIAGKGEMFLNPELEAILEYSFSRGIQLTARTGTNLNHAREQVLEALVKYRLKFLTVSIDGATEETYKIYRLGGSFAKVINNIKILNTYKDKHNSPYPELSWQFIVFGHNEHELPVARRMAEDLGMAFTPIFNEDDEYSPIIDRSLVQIGMRIDSESEFNNKFNELRVKGPLFACRQLWAPLQINWDGRLVSCMCNSVPYPVNVFQSGLRAAITEEKFAYTRKMLSGKAAARDDIPCVPCQAYQYRRAHGQYVQAENEHARALRTLIRELLPQVFGTLMRKALGRQPPNDL